MPTIICGRGPQGYILHPSIIPLIEHYSKDHFFLPNAPSGQGHQETGKEQHHFSSQIRSTLRGNPTPDNKTTQISGQFTQYQQVTFPLQFLIAGHFLCIEQSLLPTFGHLLAINKLNLSLSIFKKAYCCYYWMKIHIFIKASYQYFQILIFCEKQIKFSLPTWSIHSNFNYKGWDKLED